MDNNINSNKSGFKILRPYSALNGGLFVMFVRCIISALSAVMVFNLLFYGFNIECDYGLMMKIIFAASFIFTLLQTNNILFILSCCFVLFKLYGYVQSNKEILKNGIMTIINQSYPIISKALNLPNADGFDKVMADTYMTVNSASAILAGVVALAMVIIVVKLNSKFIFAVFLSLVFAILSFFECSINYKYATVLIICFLLMFVLNMCGTSIFKFSVLSLLNRKKYEGRFKADLMYIIQTVFICCVVCTMMLYGFYGVYNEEKFNSTFNDEYSDNIKITARDIAVMNYAEYKKFNIGNQVSLGQLGYTAYIKPSVKRNAFRFVAEPIKEGKIYFTSFVGEKYNYRYNDWTESSDDNSVMVNALKNSGADNKVYEIFSAEKIHVIPNYAEYKVYDYPGNKAEITGYEYKNVTINDENYNNYVQQTYLTIDDENKKVLDKICNENGFNKNDADIDTKIADYLKNNFTYATESEPLPYGKDFVNYFLEESKTGNFTQYATAQTLLYRNLGIPARYVSGYTVEAEQTLAGNKVGFKTNTYAKTANLHSWVEVYSSEGGWKIVDNTPVPTLAELDEKYGDKGESSYTPNTSLENYFRTVDKVKYSPENMAKAGFSMALKVIMCAVILIGAIGILIYVLKYVYGYIKYRLSDNSKKAYILMEKLMKKYKITASSYREMKKTLSEKYGEERAAEIIALGEKCIFTDNVTNEEISKLKKLMR